MKGKTCTILKICLGKNEEILTRVNLLYKFNSES
jgi:hypothetical protein